MQKRPGACILAEQITAGIYFRIWYFDIYMSSVDEMPFVDHRYLGFVVLESNETESSRLSIAITFDLIREAVRWRGYVPSHVGEIIPRRRPAHRTLRNMP